MLAEYFTDTSGTLCAESLTDRPEPAERPLFFYHVPKTGGLTFYGALCRAILYVNRFPDRLGASMSLTGVNRIDEAPLHRSWYRSTSYAVLASHHAFGFHRRFRQDFLLTTLIRDPIGRVRSDYTYNSLRDGRAVSQALFRQTFRREENINRCVKQLAGQHRFDQPAPPDLWCRAMDTLTSHFDSYVTLPDVSRLIGLYLSRFRLPNVVMERMNVTPPDHQVDPGPFRAEIAELNEQDLRLYDWVRASRRLPDLRPASPTCHPVTLILKDTGNRDRSEAAVYAIATETLIRHAQANGGRFLPASPPAASPPAVSLSWQPGHVI